MERKYLSSVIERLAFETAETALDRLDLVPRRLEAKSHQM